MDIFPAGPLIDPVIGDSITGDRNLSFSCCLSGPVVPAGLIFYRIINGKLFTILTFYSLIYFWECFGGVLIGLSSAITTGGVSLSSSLLLKTVTVYFSGYLIFLVGYYLADHWFLKSSRREKNPKIQNSGVPVYSFSSGGWMLFFFLLVVMIVFNFAQIYERIKTANSLSGYIGSMYLYRFGTFGEGATQNAFIVLMNILGGLSLSFLVLGFLMIWKQKMNRTYKWTLFFLAVVVLFQAFASTFRSNLFFSILAMLGIYNQVNPLRKPTMILFSFLAIVFLSGLNYYHQYMYYATAGWEYSTFIDSLSKLIAPHGHIQTLSRVLDTAENAPPLYGTSLWESILFFIPRFIWESKSDLYGTLIIQNWAGLPTYFQMAPTNVGELIAHFGYVGLLGMIFHGMLHGCLETMRFRSLPFKVGYYCLILPRIFPHFGMGISAEAITLFQLILFYLLVRLIQYGDISLVRIYKPVQRALTVGLR